MKMKSKHYSALALVVLLSGCLPFNERQSEVSKHIQEQKDAAKRISGAYQMETREITPYTGYNYKENRRLSDPFRARDFVLETESPTPINPDDSGQETKDTCISSNATQPNFTREKGILEDYSLDALSFVGTLRQNENVALIKTPSHGVIEIQVGEYLGKNHGRVFEIRETALVIQEKFRTGGCWEDKKTVMVIKQ
ncbi:pilus assembly protein PilP [Ostreibacterium oceani]|uniref:Pilus assembly protein PilP n=1 Tax=Ostreibacterium oceani TaxID=2654998 RepID=A0A6N7EX12_9GAMM|nr:pilus assembly protein PilP [Ostreibacterium oceani]MPV86115.1 hypothetical protein [Ostreibacterium oceani]